MALLFDSGICSAYISNRLAIRSMFEEDVRSGTARTSILIVGEVIEYIIGHRREQQLRIEFERFLQSVRHLPVTEEVAERYASLRRELRPPFDPGLIGDVDTFIAATAIVHDLTLVTTDRDYERVRGLSYRIVPQDHLRAR